MLVAPLVALLIAGLSDGEIDFGEEEQGSFERPSVGSLFFAPGLALGARGLLDYALIDWLPAVGLAVLLTLPVTLMVMRIGFAGRPQVFAGVVGVGVFAYAWGGLIQANAYTGHSSTEFSLTTVMKKRETGGRDPSHYLTLAAPLYPGVPAEVDVGPRLYGAVKVGDEICVHIHHGGLTWRWYEVDRCPT